jgi:hypothetical protein
MHYIFTFLAAIILEIASTKYIQAVSNKDVRSVVFWAFMSPLLNLPFYGILVDTSTWSERVILAIVYGLGYAVGAYLTFLKIFEKKSKKN